MLRGGVGSRPGNEFGDAGFQEVLVAARVRIVAAYAVSFRELLMRLDVLHVARVVALEAELRSGFDEQGIRFRNMRIVAAQAVAVGRGIVLELGVLEKIVVAIEAEPREPFY